jgi:hypothetical protein
METGLVDDRAEELGIDIGLSRGRILRWRAPRNPPSFVSCWVRPADSTGSPEYGRTRRGVMTKDRGSQTPSPTAVNAIEGIPTVLLRPFPSKDRKSTAPNRARGNADHSTTDAVLGSRMRPEELAELMQTLDDARNAGPNSKLWDTLRKRHTEDVAVY